MRQDTDLESGLSQEGHFGAGAVSDRDGRVSGSGGVSGVNGGVSVSGVSGGLSAATLLGSLRAAGDSEGVAAPDAALAQRVQAYFLAHGRQCSTHELVAEFAAVEGEQALFFRALLRKIARFTKSTKMWTLLEQ